LEDGLDDAAQCADWRLKPLPRVMFEYAQADSSLLLESWQILNTYLKDELWKSSPLNPIKRSNEIAANEGIP